MLNYISDKFKFKSRKTNFKNEIIGGFVTFFAMVYILPVNSAIVSGSGMPYYGVFVATTLVAAISSIAVGLFTNIPMSMAPGMGSNAFFAATMVGEFGMPWEQALAVVIINGILLTILTVTGVIKKFVDSIPLVLKYAMTVGIGLFIAYLGLKGAGIITFNKGLGFGGFDNISVSLSIIGILAVFSLIALKKKISTFAIFIVMIALVLISLIIGQFWDGSNLMAFTDIKFDYSQMSDFNKVVGQGVIAIPKAFANPETYISIFALTFMALSGNASAIVSIGESAGIMDEDGQVEGQNGAYLITGLSKSLSGILGTSPATGFLESNAGVAVGARTGFSAIVTGCLFALSIPLFPLFLPFKQGFVTAPALVYVGSLMFSNIKKIDTSDYIGVTSSFMLILIITFTANVLTGISFGFITYIVLKLVTLKGKEVNVYTYIFGVLFLAYLISLPFIS